MWSRAPQGFYVVQPAVMLPLDAQSFLGPTPVLFPLNPVGVRLVPHRAGSHTIPVKGGEAEALIVSTTPESEGWRQLPEGAGNPPPGQ